MSDFWTTSDGASAADTGGSFESGGGSFEPIPDSTTCIAVVDGAGWKQDAHLNEYIELRWSVVKPEAYENRKVFHKLWVKDADPKAKDGKAKRDKALRMFAAIDTNAGGKLAKAGREPDEDDMALALFNKPMGVKVKQWKIKDEDGGEDRVGNWIAAVFPKAEATIVEPKAKPAVKSNKADLDDDIPF